MGVQKEGKQGEMVVFNISLKHRKSIALCGYAKNRNFHPHVNQTNRSLFNRQKGL